MENEKSVKFYNILMVIFGLLMGPFELLFIIFGILKKIDIPFIKVPFIENLLLLAIFSIFIRIITNIIQLAFKKRLEDKNDIIKNRNLALYSSLISINITFLILWCIVMTGDPESSLFIILCLTVPCVAVQIPFLLPIKRKKKE